MVETRETEKHTIDDYQAIINQIGKKGVYRFLSSKPFPLGVASSISVFIPAPVRA